MRIDQGTHPEESTPAVDAIRIAGESVPAEPSVGEGDPVEGERPVPAKRHRAGVVNSHGMASILPAAPAETARPGTYCTTDQSLELRADAAFELKLA